mgnify:CR=1 FL=1
MAFQKGHLDYRRKYSDEPGEKAVETTVPEPTPEAGQGDTAATLISLGQAFLAMAQEKTDKAKAMVGIADMLGKLSAADYPALLDHPEVQRFVDGLIKQKAESTDDPPGTIYNKGTLAEHKKPWQWRDLDNAERITFTPNETRLIVFNGLPLTIIADVENTVPAPFYGLYVESKRNTRFAQEHAEWLMRKRDNPTHPDMATPDSVRARAIGGVGWYEPGSGPHAGAAPISDEEGKGGEAA